MSETEKPLDVDFKRRAVFIGAGIILISYSYPDSGVAKLPLRALLHDQLGVSPQEMAKFFAIANIPSWCKPVIGLLSDSFPIFGTKRRHYLLLASLMGVVLWGVMGFVPRQYVPLLIMGLALNALCTVCGTINGAVLFEEGKKKGATGRLTSIRSICNNLGALAMGPLAGFLAKQSFGWVVSVEMMFMLSLFALGLVCLRERHRAERDLQVWKKAGTQLKVLFYSGSLWAAAGLMFLVQVAPGFSTPLFYYQTEKLHFDLQFIGNLGAWSSAFCFLAGVLYLFICKKLVLRRTIAICIILAVITTLGYLNYGTQSSAVIIESAYGLGSTLGFLALFDLAARATPKGSEAMGYSVLYAFINIALSMSDILGAKLFEAFGQRFPPMIWINAATTALVLLAVPFLPERLVGRRDGEVKA